MAEGEVRVVFKSEDRMTDGVKKAKSGLADLGKAVGIATAAFGTMAVAAKQAFDFSKEGAEIIRLEGAATKMAAQFGQSMNLIVAAMRRGSGETIDDLTLMAAASRALQLGVAQTPEDFERLTTAAVALGRAMGRGPAEAIDDIVTGIGRMSPLILDNLGIMTNGGKVFDDYAASIGKTTDELTDLEKKQALLNITVKSAEPLLDENGRLVNDAATAYDRLGVLVKNATDNLKEMAANALVPELEASLAARDEAGRLANAMQVLGGQVDGVERGIVRMRDGTIMTKAAFIALAETPIQTSLRAINDEMTGVAGAANKARENVEGLTYTMILQKAFAAELAGDQAAADYYRAVARQAYQAKQNIDAYIRSFEKAAELGRFALDAGGRKDVSEGSLRDELKDMR